MKWDIGNESGHPQTGEHNRKMRGEERRKGEGWAGKTDRVREGKDEEKKERWAA